MDWAAEVDNYCERLGPGFWGEPVNAVTNLAFLIAAVFVFPKVRGDRGAEILCLALFLIGVASGLFHTLATSWAGLADSLSILVFILIYIFLAVGRVLGLGRGAATVSVIAFFPYAFATGYALSAIFGPLNGSVAYLPVLILIFVFGVISDGDTRRGFWTGAAILAVSLLFRSIDETLCHAWPLGTHFMWHALNAIMLAWMILVIHRAPANARSGVARHQT